MKTKYLKKVTVKAIIIIPILIMALLIRQLFFGSSNLSIQMVYEARKNDMRVLVAQTNEILDKDNLHSIVITSVMGERCFNTIFESAPSNESGFLEMTDWLFNEFDIDSVYFDKDYISLGFRASPKRLEYCASEEVKKTISGNMWYYNEYIWLDNNCILFIKPNDQS